MSPIGNELTARASISPRAPRRARAGLRPPRRRSRSGGASRRAPARRPRSGRGRPPSRGEVVVDEPGEVLLEQVDDREGEERRHERRAALEDVAAVEDRADDRRVGGRPADAALLERLDEARLGVARRRRGRVALRVELTRRRARRPCFEVRERALLLAVLRVVVAASSYAARKPRNVITRAGGGELDVAPGRRRCAEPQRDGQHRARRPSATRSCASRSGRRARARPGSARLELASACGTESPAGRIASCASCAFLTLRCSWRGFSGMYSAP